MKTVIQNTKGKILRRGSLPMSSYTGHTIMVGGHWVKCLGDTILGDSGYRIITVREI